MVYEWYSTYKNVMKYFVSMEIQDLLLREAKVKGSGKGEQTLIIFPDNWTRYAMLDGKIAEKSLQLYSTDTQNRKDINWWAVKKGQAHTVVATQSEVFQPFKALKKIIFIDSQKWYYHNQQDPRYSLSTVVKKMAELYEAEVEEVKNERRLM
jgi:primosomal protein N'